jgi:solute carrier family 25 protein 44
MGTTSTDYSEINKVRFFTIGTVLYSGLTTMLHPASVIKVRQQVLGSGEGVGRISLGGVLADAKQLKWDGIRNMYRGLGVVLSLAVPARVIYVTALEGTRVGLTTVLNDLDVASPTTVATISAGMAGGIAAVASQLMAVPMDIISQRQMVSNTTPTPSTRSIVQSVLASNEGVRGLYRGFGISLFASLPTGTVWWATYAACQEQLAPQSSPSTHPLDESIISSLHPTIRWIAVQLCSGVSAAVVAASLSQPLDVVKTRLQVASSDSKSVMTDVSCSNIVKTLWNEPGIQGFYKGMLPRMIHMSLWGTILASAYEYLKFISRHPEVIPSVFTEEEELMVARNAQLANRVTKVTIQADMH